jgi:hypothetical protein
MNRLLTIQDFLAVCRQLGASPQEINACFSCPSLFTAENLEKLKVIVKRHWRRVAFRCHPDRNNGDDTEFKKLNTLYQLVQSAKIKPRPPQVVYTVFTATDSAASTTTTSSTPFTTYYPFGHY